MSDPIADLIEALKSDSKIRFVARKLTASFLNNVADVFETYGFATARQYLKEQQSRGGDMQVQATALLAALDHMEKFESVHRNRSIGRLIIKTLRQVYSQ